MARAGAVMAGVMAERVAKVGVVEAAVQEIAGADTERVESWVRAAHLAVQVGLKGVVEAEEVGGRASISPTHWRSQNRPWSK